MSWRLTSKEVEIIAYALYKLTGEDIFDLDRLTNSKIDVTTLSNLEHRFSKAANISFAQLEASDDIDVSA